LIAIEYHLSDPFANGYASSRFSYYGGTGTPTTWIDGIYEYVGGGSGNYAQYRGAFNARKGISSPFVINLDGSYSPQSYTGNITAEIIATGTPGSNLKLRYVIVETDIEFSWQGEDSVYFVERSMFPSASGVSISMSQGDTLYNNQNFTFDPSWNFINSYIAVFVQNESTKEIQQSAKWVIPIDVPNISYVGHYIDDSSGDNDGRADPGETVDMIVSLYNSPPFKPATNVTATISNNDPDITLINATSDYPDIPVDSTVNNASDPFSFSVDAGATVHRTQFIMDIEAQPNNYYTTDTVEIMIGRPDIIFVDNDGGEEYGNIENYFSAAIESLGIKYDMVSDSAIEMQFLDEYQVIVWFTGSLSDSTVTSESQALLSSYLDGGGNLFITGQDIGQDIGGTTFYTDYLHSIFVTDDVNYYGIIGVTGDPIGDGLTLTITGGGGANNQTSPSAISKTSDAESVFVYPGALGPCGVRYGGTYKTVYFSFGFEAINDEGKRIEVLRRILQWFDLIQGISESPGYNSYVNPQMTISPNPFTSEVSIQCSGISDSKDISIEIYDLSGRLVRSFSLFSSHSSLVRSVSWDGTDKYGKPLPNGVYFCKLKSGSRVLSKEKIIMVK
jgi:hypothetical protein